MNHQIISHHSITLFNLLNLYYIVFHCKKWATKLQQISKSKWTRPPIIQVKLSFPPFSSMLLSLSFAPRLFSTSRALNSLSFGHKWAKERSSTVKTPWWERFSPSRIFIAPLLFYTVNMNFLVSSLCHGFCQAVSTRRKKENTKPRSSIKWKSSLFIQKTQKKILKKSKKSSSEKDKNKLMNISSVKC